MSVFENTETTANTARLIVETKWNKQVQNRTGMSGARQDLV